VKIVTTAAALHYLGPDRRIRTEVYAEPDARGIVRGDLFIKGHGDPWLVPERLWHLASRVKYQGVRSVRGNIVVDASHFDGPDKANGWEQDRTTHSYMAKAGALSVGFNSLLIHVLPGVEAGASARVFVEPGSAYASVEGSIATVSRGRTWVEVEIEPRGNRSVVKVSGRIALDDAGRGYWRRVDNPTRFSGEVFRALLKQVGVGVRGRVVEGIVPNDAERLVALASPRLAEMAQKVNKHSNNFMAAQIARVLGAEVYGPPGTWEKGRQAIEAFLADEVGIERNSYILGNASGLHDVNRFTPRQMVRILEHMARRPSLKPEFVASLAVAGGAGTLSERMGESSAGLLRAKTGTLSSASALSGYVTCRSGEALAFSIIVNDYQVSIQEVWRVQDDLGALLAEVDFSGRPAAAALTAGATP
jgi:D-alanyl-D-alanine carboxypeptidase/D-alanyl-D-alanine-endopeptidase (penicillin-binding protein 4)